jgi:hypothetical protein
VLGANDPALAMFACGSAGLVGEPIDGRQPVGSVVRDLVRTGGSDARRTAKLEGRRANGVPFPVEVSVGLARAGAHQACSPSPGRATDH